MEYKTVVQRVRKIVRLLSRSADEVDDISQNALIKILRTKRRPCDIGNKWLYSVVKNCFLDAKKSSNRRAKYISQEYFVDSSGVVRDSDGDDEDNVILHPSMYNLIGSNDLDHRKIMERVFDNLPPTLQQVLLLAAQGYTYPEIAKISHVKIGTVRSRLNRARIIARNVLDRL